MVIGCIAGWQPAHRLSTRRPRWIQPPAECHSAIRPTASRRYLISQVPSFRDASAAAASSFFSLTGKPGHAEVRSMSTPANPDSSTRSSSTKASGPFTATRWSVVLAAGRPDSAAAAAALEQLCGSYWHPLYAYARHQGHLPPDAEDLTQEFFARLLAKNYLASADKEKGRFRSFLLTMFKRFLADEWDRSRAQKRGGGLRPLTIDTETAEAGYQQDWIEDATPERVFEQRWALSVVNRAINRLEAEFTQAGRAVEFERLKTFLTLEKGAIPYAAAATEYGMTEGALRVAIHRLRQKFRRHLRAEVAQTVASPEEIEEEIRYLLTVLSR